MILFLNDIGTSEVMLILFFILIFFGSKSIPGIARTLGRTIRQVKDATNDIQNEIKKSGADMKKDLNLKSLIEETTEDIKRPLDQYVEDIDHAVRYEPRKKSSLVEVKPVDPITGKQLEPKTDEIADDNLLEKSSED